MVFVIVMMAIVSALDLGFGKLVFEIFTGRVQHVIPAAAG